MSGKRHKIYVTVLFAALALCQGGCVVYSLYPWLGEKSVLAEPLLAGAWYDAEADVTAFFSPAGKTGYEILTVSEKREQGRVTAELHRIGQTLLLVVGPADPDNMPLGTLPAYHLLRVELTPVEMKLFDIDLESFGERIRKAGIKFLDEGSKENGYVLLSPTRDLETFVAAQLSDPGFFSDRPVNSFRKMSKK